LDENFLNILFSILVANIDKILLLSNKPKYADSLVNYKINLQTTFTHHNSFKTNDYSVLLQLFRNNGDSQIFELKEQDLTNVLNKLKEIHGRIKIN
jgi:hypothetical protein